MDCGLCVVWLLESTVYLLFESIVKWNVRGSHQEQCTAFKKKWWIFIKNGKFSSNFNWHITSGVAKPGWGSKRLAAHIQQELTQFPAPPPPTPPPHRPPREIEIPCFYEISVKEGTQSRALRRNPTKLEQLLEPTLVTQSKHHGSNMNLAPRISSHFFTTVFNNFFGGKMV